MSQEVTGWPELPEIVSYSHAKSCTSGLWHMVSTVQWLQVGSPLSWGWELHLCTPTHYPGSSWSPLTWGKSNQDMGPAGTHTKAIRGTSPPHCCDLPEPMEASGTRPQNIQCHKQTHPPSQYPRAPLPMAAGGEKGNGITLH